VRIAMRMCSPWSKASVAVVRANDYLQLPGL